MMGAINQHAEVAVLGAIMLAPNCLSKIQAERLTPDDFFYPGNGDIFRAMCSLAERGEPVELATVWEEMRRADTLQVAGGIEYLESLLAAATTAEHADHYARMLVDLANRRSLAMTGAEMAAMAPSATPDEIAAYAMGQMEAVFERSKSAKGRPVMKDIVRAVFHHMQDALDKPTGRGLPTGFVQIDNMLGNLRPSQFVVIGARPGVGKTSWLLNVTLNVALSNHPVGFFSLEMAGDELVRRMLAMKSGVDHMRLLRAEVRDDEWPRVVEAARVLSPLPIVIEDSPMTLANLRQRVRFMVREQGVKLLCVDYLQLVKNKSAQNAREREVAEVSASLKELAKEHRVPLVALAQLNRGLENRQNRKPQLSDLRESGSIEQDADFVGFLHRDPAAEVVVDRAKAEFIAAKNRHGPTGVVPMRFLPEITSFEEDDGAPKW